MLALRPLKPRRSGPFNWSFWFGYLFNELPFLVFFWLFTSTLSAFQQHIVNSPAGWIAFGLAVLATIGLAVIVKRQLRADQSVCQALNDRLGAGWRDAIDTRMAALLEQRPSFSCILFAPFFVSRPSVKRVANIAYGDAGKWNLLDVYHHRDLPPNCPTLIYLHGGAFRSGWKNREALPLLYRLANQGWLCISANYRLSPAARFPDHLIDLKKVIAWVREYGGRYGADPATIFTAGSSAGGCLAVMAALTPNDPAFQPDFEHTDTSVAAAISLYGYYGSVTAGGPNPSSPLAYVRPDAPPVFMVHGYQDTIVIVEDARNFARKLQLASSSPVVYAELPGAQHTFDLFHSLRFEAVIDGIEAFAAWVRSRKG
ncbi:alpha/beta hydrolase [Anseongella ginsenosidimutans]|nr:alpha/beta hydrolase [Anseongella ginsenosidimutans]